MRYNINDKGVEYYKVMLKDTKKAIFGVGPFSILFFGLCFSAIAEFEFNTMLKLIMIPYLAIFYLFFYMPIGLRGKMFSNIVKSVNFEKDEVEFETFDWILFKSKHHKLRLYNIDIEETNEGLRKFKYVYRLKVNDVNAASFYVYIVRDFFDDWDGLVKELNSKTQSNDAS